MNKTLEKRADSHLGIKKFDNLLIVILTALALGAGVSMVSQMESIRLASMANQSAQVAGAADVNLPVAETTSADMEVAPVN